MAVFFALFGFASRALRQAQGDNSHPDVNDELGYLVTLSLSKGLEREAKQCGSSSITRAIWFVYYSVPIWDMQTVLLTIWPFLNLLLFVGLFSTLMRFIANRLTNKVYRIGAQLAVFMAVSLASNTATRTHSQTFTFLTPQPVVPVRQEAYHDGILIDAPTFSIKSHVAIWPVTLPNVMQPTDTTSTQQSDALKLTLAISISNMMPGLVWTTDHVDVRLLSNRQVGYEASGYVTWRLLGLPVYNQEKRYKGVVNI